MRSISIAILITGLGICLTLNEIHGKITDEISYKIMVVLILAWLTTTILGI